MKIVKKWLFVLLLGCIAISATGCSDSADGDIEEPEATETALMSETTTTMAMETTTTGSETTTSETTSEETTETTTETSTTETTTTTTETTTETTTTTTIPETTTVIVETETAPETSPISETVTVSQRFEPGIWWSTSSDGDRYFCFYSGSDSGSFRDQESGIGLSFEYEAEENSDRIIFHIGDSSDSTYVTVNFADSSTAELTWDNGSVETLKYQGLGNFDTFKFYSNLELCEMAVESYERQNGERPADSSAQIQANGKITIELYSSLGDSNSAIAWYTVDRFSAKGTDITGNSIDLKN